MEKKEKISMDIIQESLEELVSEDGLKQKVKYLVQKTKMIVSKHAHDTLMNFKKFGKALDPKKSMNINKLSQGIEFDGGVTEDNVVKKLTKDKDLAKLQRLEREKMEPSSKTTDGTKNPRRLMEEFEDISYCFRICDVALMTDGYDPEQNQNAEQDFHDFFRVMKDEAERKLGFSKIRCRPFFKRNFKGKLTGIVHFRFDDKTHGNAVYKEVDGVVYNNYVLHPEWLSDRKRT